MASESIYFNSKSIVGATSVVVGSTYLPQTTLQATGTTTLIGNVFVQGGVLYPPRPMTANTTSISGFAYGNGTYVAFAPEQSNPANAYLAFDGDITTVSDSVTTSGFQVYSSAFPYNYSNTTITGGFSNTFDVTSTNYPGVYIQLLMPPAVPLVLEYYTIFPTAITRGPGTWRVFGSQTGAIGSWVSLDSRASITWADPQVSQTFYLSPVPVAYLYFRLSVQNLAGNSQILDVSQWNLYGRPPVPAMSILGGDLSISSGGGLIVGSGTIGSNVAIFSNVGGGSNVVVINSNAWVGIGTTSPTASLHVLGNAFASNALTAPSLFASSNITVGGASVGSNIAVFSNGTNITVINSNAWVGIGTTNPTSSLQVNGNASFATDTFTVPFATVGTMSVLSGLTIGPSSTILGSNLAVFANASGGSNVTIFTGNALSIGTLTPTATLHVVGSMGSNIAVFSNGYSNGIFVINQWSNVGIGLANPQFQLDLSTDGGRQPTSANWKTGSDQRVKSNIVAANLITCYNTIKSLNLKYFQWNFPDMQPIDQHSLGFIAQEVVNYFPKAVFPSDSHGFPDFLNINVDQIVKAMYGALKKTIDDKEALEEKLELAQNDIDLLETRLSDLEALVRTLLPQKETTQTGPRSAALINQM